MSSQLGKNEAPPSEDEASEVEPIQSVSTYSLSEFSRLPPEIVYHVFGFLNKNDGFNARNVCCRWNCYVLTGQTFLSGTSFKISDSNSLDVLRGSHVGWNALELLTDATITTSEVQQFLNEASSLRGNCITKLSFKTMTISRSQFQSTIAACPNLKHLKLYVLILTDDAEPEETDTSIVTKKLAEIGSGLREIRFIYASIMVNQYLLNTIVKHATRLEKFCLHEGNYRMEQPSDERLSTTYDRFLKDMLDVIIQNKMTLKELDVSFPKPFVMIRYYHLVLRPISNHVVNVQKLGIHLYQYGTSEDHPYDSIFWKRLDENAWNEAAIFENNDPLADRNPTSLMKIWMNFIKAQKKLKTVKLPQIDLDLKPFEVEHFQAYHQLLKSIPATVTSLKGLVMGKGITIPTAGDFLNNNVISWSHADPIQENLKCLSTRINFKHFPSNFLDLEIPANQPLLPMCPKLKKLKLERSTTFMHPPDSMKFYKNLIAFFLPTTMTHLRISGLTLCCDETLQMIIKSLKMLESLKLEVCAREPFTDFGITGISKSWLKEVVLKIEKFSEFIDANETLNYEGQEWQKPEFTGQSLCEMKHLRVLKMPNLSRLSDIGVHYGLQLPKLQKLFFTTDTPYNKVTNWGLEKLSQNCPMLETVKITCGCLTTLEGIELFVNNLTRLKRRTCLINRNVKTHYAPTGRLIQNFKVVYKQHEFYED